MRKKAERFYGTADSSDPQIPHFNQNFLQLVSGVELS